MAPIPLIEQIQPGMIVRSSDNKRLGTVTLVYTRDTESYVKVTPRANLWKPWQLMIEIKCLFLPGSTVASVTEKTVYLALDAKTAKGCTVRPTWIPREGASQYSTWGVGGN